MPFIVITFDASRRYNIVSRRSEPRRERSGGMEHFDDIKVARAESEVQTLMQFPAPKVGVRIFLRPRSEIPDFETFSRGICNPEPLSVHGLRPL